MKHHDESFCEFCGENRVRKTVSAYQYAMQAKHEAKLKHDRFVFQVALAVFLGVSLFGVLLFIVTG